MGEQYVFTGRVRVYRVKIRDKEYRRYIITVPPAIGSILDPEKTYKVILVELDNEETSS